MSLEGDDDLSFVCYVDPNVPAAPAAPTGSGEDDKKFIRVMELVKQRRPDLFRLAVRVEFVTRVSDPEFFSSSTGYEYNFGPGHRPSISIYKYSTDDDAATFVIQALGEYIVLQNKVNDAVLQNIKKSKEPHDDLGVLLRKLDAPGPTTNTKLGTWEGLEYNRAFSIVHDQVIGIGIVVSLDIVFTLTGGKVAEFASHLYSSGWKLVKIAEGAPLRWLNPSGRLATKLDLETAAREFASAGKKGTPKPKPNPTTPPPSVTPKGGEYGTVRGANRGGEVHHMPAAKVTPYPYKKAPASWMETVDHRKTASWGSSKAAEVYRQKQANLINQGQLREAIQMDIDDIRSKFGNKYDANIKEMLDAFGFSH